MCTTTEIRSSNVAAWHVPGSHRVHMSDGRHVIVTCDAHGITNMIPSK
jgi:hypothetical protein